MQRNKVKAAMIVFGSTLVLASAVALMSAQPAEAQCGSQASSCKNCHETQGQDPVNADGTGWHESHAFGDFCYICHAGNNQATDKAAAHAGMVAPMNDVQAACAQCHPSDLQARADVYTAALGIAAIQVGAQVAAPTALAAALEAAAESVAAEPASAPAPHPAAAEDGQLVDYVARYNEEVLHKQQTNWGNVILIVILLGMLAAGIIFINRREGWITVSFSEKKPVTKEYPEDVLRVADAAGELGTAGRTALLRLLGRPAAASELLKALDRLSTDDASGDTR